MAIVCGTDFTAGASRAADVAALFAARLGVPLHLVHVAAPGGAAAALPSLERETKRVRRGAPAVRAEAMEGLPDEALTATAAALGAGLVVVSSLGTREASRWRLGGTADRVAQTSAVPVLVVRNADALAKWLARGKKPLRVVVGLDLTAASEAPLRWLATLAGAGALRVVAAFACDAAAEARRMGIEPGENAGAAVEPALRREIESRLRRAGLGRGSRAVVFPAGSDAAERFLGLAAEEGADLVVVGTHGRRGIERMWHGSFSSAVLEGAGVPVVCVPAPAFGPAGKRVAPVERVLVALDLSDVSAAAVPHGYGVVARGGQVVLFHVAEPDRIPNPMYAHYSPGRARTPEERDRDLASARRHLQSLVPADAAERGIETRVEIVQAEIPSEAIVRAAERIGADLICVGTHGRGGLARTLLGSVAREVLGSSHRPVLVVRPPG